MPRDLSFTLDSAMTSGLRRPVYKLEVYDLKSSTANTISDIVLGNTLESIVGPLDFTDMVVGIQIAERAAEFSGDGVASTEVSFTVVDPNAQWDPLEGAQSRWLRQGNVIRLTEGDAAESDTSLHPLTFTGVIVGQPGFDSNRTTGESRVLVKCFDRASRFLKLEESTRNFVQGTLYGNMARDIAKEEMGMVDGEILFTAGSQSTSHLVTQFVEQSPLLSIAQIHFVDGATPRFTGEGKLTRVNGLINKAPARVYDDAGKNQISIVRPMSMLDGVNEVEILGLEAEMTEVLQPPQVLATATVTAGFFSPSVDLDVVWSADNTNTARNPTLRVLQTINGFIPFGGEDFSFVTLPDGGTLGGTIEVSTGFAGPILLALITTAAIAASYIPDKVTVFGGTGTMSGWTWPTGRAVQQAILSGGLTLMAQIGHGRYEVIGQPYEMVFREIRALARIAGVLSSERNSVTIENQLINTQADADAIALRTLKRLRSQQNVRAITMIHDLMLEPDDIFEVDGRRYMIVGITRTLARQSGASLAMYDCFEVTTGVKP